MSDPWFAILLAIILLFLTGLSVILLIWPSKFLRHIQNPWQPDTPLNRVQIRPVGIFFCLFVLLIISGSTKTLEGFHRNILLALWLSPVILPIFLWILWRYSSLQQVNRRCLAGEPDSAQWELRMSVAFSSLLLTMVAAAFFLGVNGIYLK
jgi:Mn2+/Fe2+ NRAMP family transporter